MAHQYVHEILGAPSRALARPAFRGLPTAGDRCSWPECRAFGRRGSGSLTFVRRPSSPERVGQLALAQELERPKRSRHEPRAEAMLSTTSTRQRSAHARLPLSLPSCPIGTHHQKREPALGLAWRTLLRRGDLGSGLPGVREAGQVLKICGTLPNLEMATHVRVFIGPGQAAGRAQAHHGITSNATGERIWPA
jgi:hypothetical protein